MKLLNTTEQSIKKVTHTFSHNDTEYTLVDYYEGGQHVDGYFEGGKLIDTILRDKGGTTIEDAALLEEFITFLDNDPSMFEHLRQT
jgi:hypothetical protein